MYIKMARIKEEVCPFSVRLPITLSEEIDQICAANYITRTSFMIKAAKEKLERDRLGNTEKMIAKLSKIEEAEK